jgi:hypothetical protein
MIKLNIILFKFIEVIIEDNYKLNVIMKTIMQTFYFLLFFQKNMLPYILSPVSYIHDITL